MKAEMHRAPHFAFSAMIIFSLCLQTSANHSDYPRDRNGTWNPISQNLSGSQNLTEANTNSPLGTNLSSGTTSLRTQTSSLQSISFTTTPNSTSPPARSDVSAMGGLRNSSKPKSTMTKETTCEDNKPLILICFIVMAVLVLICTFLFLSTVVMANKMSYLKKTQQGKRRPRSNGDILATNSLWPTAAGTWQRMPKEPAGTDLTMQDLVVGREAATQRKTDDETPKRLTEETGNGQENKTPKSHKPILTNFVVEI
ncbi:protein EVI2A [Indicator indicator]|uniref:protein EVI2A n=1 Tax=Indicator indicator TaxID=1002788 RepID=UPI0023DF3FE7|nr:protein EVI2A [Indicator indicator]